MCIPILVAEAEQQQRHRKVCRHCQRRAVSRPRGLCWNCYYRPGVRDLYPSTSKYGYRGFGNTNCQSRQPDYPTDTEPGTEERIRVLQERASLRQALFHPRDRIMTPAQPSRLHVSALAGYQSVA